MPIDTAAKRSQMLGFGNGDTLPIPDGTIAQADRQHLLWLYGGILFGAPVALPAIDLELSCESERTIDLTCIVTRTIEFSQETS